MIIIVSLAVLLTALLCVKVKISIRYNGTLSFKAYIADFEIPLHFFKRKKQYSDDEEKSSESEEARFADHTVKIAENAKTFAASFKTASKLTQKFLTVEKFIVQITAGTGSAPSTAISTGMLWATVYNVIAVIGTVLIIENPVVEITPDYSQAVFKSYAKCIISARVAYIILIGIVILSKKLSRKGKEE